MAGTTAAEAPLRRVMVVGCAGAGKTTFARRLAHALGVPAICLDFHFWRPGWQVPDREAWRAQTIALAALPAWVMDGNYSSTYDVRMPRAECLVWLDHPRATCLRRVLLRTIRGYGRTRPDLPEGCPERFDLAFLRYVWDFPRQHRPRIATGIERSGSHLRVVRLVCDSDVEHFLAANRAS
jgi:adenylate kinase family enzyme